MFKGGGHFTVCGVNITLLLLMVRHELQDKKGFRMICMRTVISQSVLEQQG